MTDDLYDSELEQLRDALRRTAPDPGPVVWGPGPEGRIREAAFWLERAACALPAGHPMKFRRPPAS
jgi:hypothetical protein